MRTLLTGLASLTLTTACVDLSGTSSNVEGADQAGDTDECKIEGSQIGRENLVMDLGNKTVTFTDWVAKPGSPGEYNGFTITVDGASSISYIVKAGTQRFASTTMSWTHPSGLAANAISNVDFCEGDDGGGDGGGDDGGGDGCIEGCDDGSGDGGGGDDGGGGGFDGPGGDDGTGICFEPGGCDGAGGDLPPLTDGGGDGSGDGCIEGCDGPIL
jgi:hypothetical protein